MKLLEQNVSVPETQVTNLQTPPRQKKNCLAKVKQSKVLLNLLFEVKAKERENFKIYCFIMFLQF